MSLLTDLRFALRLWRRHPTLVVVAGLSLGLGVGATTTMYSVMSKVPGYPSSASPASIPSRR